MVVPSVRTARTMTTFPPLMAFELYLPVNRFPPGQHAILARHGTDPLAPRRRRGSPGNRTASPNPRLRVRLRRSAAHRPQRVPAGTVEPAHLLRARLLA